MISFLFHFFKTVSLGVLINEHLKRNYPENYADFLFNVSFELLHLYSKGQILYNQVGLKISSIIESNAELKKIRDRIYSKQTDIQKNQIYQIKGDSIHIKSYTNKHENEEKDKDNIETYFEPDENSIYLFVDNENASENKCANRVILHSPTFSTKYEVSNIQFMLVEVKINDVSYKISLKTDVFNYYIVDNILDLKFFKYYLYNYQVGNLSSEDRLNLNKLNVKIIDQNVNVREFEITDDKFIVIKKEDYIY